MSKWLLPKAMYTCIQFSGTLWGVEVCVICFVQDQCTDVGPNDAR